MRSKLSQHILIALDRSFQMESISFLTRFERREKPDLSLNMLSAKQGSILYHFYKVFGMMRSRIEPTTSCLRGECSNHWATIAHKNANANHLEYQASESSCTSLGWNEHFIIKCQQRVKNITCISSYIKQYFWYVSVSKKCQ